MGCEAVLLPHPFSAGYLSTPTVCDNVYKYVSKCFYRCLVTDNRNVDPSQEATHAGLQEVAAGPSSRYLKLIFESSGTYLTKK